MTVILPPICLGCTRFRKQDGATFTCEAYPDAIPEKIIESAVDHRKPYEGDHGLQFKAQDDTATAYAHLLFPEE